jgi:hypothetical protein
MACLSSIEQQEFINDFDRMGLDLLHLIPDDKKAEAKNNVDKFVIKWGKLYNPIVRNPTELVRKNFFKLQSLYIELKQSVVYNNTDIAKASGISLDIIDTIDTIENCISNLQTLKLNEQHNKALNRFSQYQMGKVLKKLNLLTLSQKQFIEHIKPIGYCKSYAYFLINFFEACEKYTNLKYTTFPLDKLKNNFTDLLNFMKDDLAFWSPVATPTVRV